MGGPRLCAWIPPRTRGRAASAQSWGASRLGWHLRLLWGGEQLQPGSSLPGFQLLVRVTTLRGQDLRPQLAAEFWGRERPPPASRGPYSAPSPQKNNPLSVPGPQPGPGSLPGSQEGPARGQDGGPSPGREAAIYEPASRGPSLKAEMAADSLRLKRGTETQTPTRPWGAPRGKPAGRTRPGHTQDARAHTHRHAHTGHTHMHTDTDTHTQDTHAHRHRHTHTGRTRMLCDLD